MNIIIAIAMRLSEELSTVSSFYFFSRISFKNGGSFAFDSVYFSIKKLNVIFENCIFALKILIHVKTSRDCIIFFPFDYYY